MIFITLLTLLSSPSFAQTANTPQKPSTEIRVSPYSESDRAAGLAGPAIKIREAAHSPTSKHWARKALNNFLEGQIQISPPRWVAEYQGPLYGACGSYCGLQGYKILLSEDGTVLRFLRKDLLFFGPQGEQPLVATDYIRLREISNDKDLLKKAYEWAKGDRTDAYTGGMSRLSEMGPSRKAGNSFGTFIIHLSKIREALGLKNWPIYDGPAPGRRR